MPMKTRLGKSAPPYADLSFLAKSDSAEKSIRSPKYYTGADCRGWMHEAGFKETRIEPLSGADSMAIGIK